RKELHAKGFLSDTRYLEYQQELNALKGDISRANTAIAVANAEKAEYENRLKLSGADYTNSVNERLDAVLADKRQNTELIEKLGSRVARLAVRAPVSGTV